MHDFLLAKEIIDELKKIVEEKKLSGIKKVYIEIGTIALSHDGYPEHTEDISVENLEFGLKSISQDKIFKEAEFIINKVPGQSWKIADIEV